MKPAPLVIAAAMAVYGIVRRKRISRGEWIFGSIVGVALVLYGTGVIHPPSLQKLISDAGTHLGKWTYLLVGVRQDVTFDRSDSAVLQDGTGEIIANAFQDDLTAFRIYMRVGVAIGRPLDPTTGVAIAPFEFADWTA